MNHATIMKYAKPPIGARVAKTAAIASAIALLAASCINDNVGRLLKERSALEMKKDSVERAYGEKENQIKRGMDMNDAGLSPMAGGFCKLEELYRQREKQVKPIEERIDSVNKEFRKYDAFGRPLADPF